MRPTCLSLKGGSFPFRRYWVNLPPAVTLPTPPYPDGFGWYGASPVVAGIVLAVLLQESPDLVAPIGKGGRLIGLRSSSQAQVRALPHGSRLGHRRAAVIAESHAGGEGFIALETCQGVIVGRKLTQ